MLLSLSLRSYDDDRSGGDERDAADGQQFSCCVYYVTNIIGLFWCISVTMTEFNEDF